MNLVANYMKNIGKSVAYATIEHVKEKAPAMASFSESNQELYQETYHALRDYKTTMNKTKQYIQASPLYKAGDSWFNNAWEDIKTGNLYNTARDDTGMDDFGDFGEDFGDMGMGDGKPQEPIGAGDQLVVSTVESASRKNAFAVTNAVASSAKYLADTNKSIANMNYVQNTRMMGVMESGFKGLSSGLDALHSFNASAMSTHIENSQKFFSNMTQLGQERNAMLKEMRDIMVEQHKAKVEEEKEKKYNRFDDIVNAQGTPDIKAYMKAIGGNFKNAVNEKSGGAMGFLSEENLKMLTNNPLGFIPQFIIGSMMGPGLNTAVQKFDKTIQGAFSTAIARLNKMASNSEASPLTQFLGQVFGLKNNVKGSIDTSKFERGSISFDGETKKSIVEIIPGHLRKIEAALTGMPERMYDMKSGKWTDATKLQKSFKSMKEGFVKNSMSDVSDEMGQMLQSIYFENRKEKEEFVEGMQNAMTKIYEDFGSYNPHEKDSFKHLKYGFKNKTDQKLFDQMFKNLRRGTAMNMSGEVMNSREMQNKYMEELEKKGTSVFNNLFNNSGLNDLVQVDENTGKVKSKLGNVGDTLNPLKVEDKFKKNIFDYLRNMENYLFDIRKINAVQNGGGPGNGRRRKGNSALTNYGHFSEDDWAAHDKARMGTPQKSQKELDKERRENADRNYYERAKSDLHDRNKNGKITAKYDRYAEDTSQMTETIYMNAVSRNIHDQVRSMNDNSTWLNDTLKDSAKEAKNTLADKDYNQVSKSGKKDNIFNRLMKAGSLSEKYAVIRDSLGELASKPATILTSVIGKADEQIYDFFYGKETGEKDENGNPIKGFFNKMSNDMSKTFRKLNGWIDDKILDPINKKFGGKNLWDSAKKGLKGATGVDVDEMWQKGKDFFVGDSGILRPTIDAVKNAYKEAYEEVKRDMKKSYKDANKFLHNDILNEETSEQKVSRVKGMTGVNNVSDDSAFRYAMGMAGNSKKKAAAAKVKMLTNTRNDLLQSIQKQSDIVSKLESSKDANPAMISKERAKLEKLKTTLNQINSRISQASVPVDNTDSVQNFKLNQLKISKINEKISGYANDDSELLEARKEKTTNLETAKKSLGVSGKLSDIDINAKGNEYLKDKAIAPVFEKAKKLEEEVSKMKTELEKMQEEKAGLYSKQKDLWKGTGTTKESLMSNPEFLMSIASANKSGFKGDSKAYNTAMQELSSIVGYDSSKKQGSAPPKALKDIERSYFDAVKSLKLGEANTAEKVLRTRINVNEAKGDKPSALINSLNNILSAKAETYGQYRAQFSTALGNMGISSEQISATVDKILQDNTPERLREINSSIHSFIDAARRANPSIGSLISDYDGKDTNVGNYAIQGGRNTFYNQSNSNYEAETSHIWKENTDSDGNAINPLSRIDLAKRGVIPLISQSEKIGKDKEYRNTTGMFSDGARMITKSGLAVLSPGEAVIPADENPYNPDMDTADRSSQSKNEKGIKSRFLSKIKGLSSSDIGEYANGTPSYGDDKPGIMAQGFSQIRGGVSDFMGQMFDSSDVKKRVDNANEIVKKHLPKGVAGGMVGGTAGLFLGGPLLGAVLGAATSIASNSETLQETIFGKEIYDANGEKTGRDDSGMISGKMQKSIAKYLPDAKAKAYGVAGGVLGLLTPFGPLGGLLLGSGIAFAKNNDSVKKALFGEKDGLINGDTQKMVKKAFPAVAAATLGTLFLGPFGMMGNALLGAGIGMVGSTDEFKDFMLGKPGKDGKRTGGLAGEIRSKVVGPLANMASGVQKRFFNFMQKDMLDPIKNSIAPIGKQISLAIKDTFSVVGSVVGKALKSTLGIPLVKRVGEMLKTAMDPFGINAKVAKFGAKWAGKAISMPSKAIGWLGNKAREHQISKSNADYMTADERLEFMNKRGKDYKLKDYDTMLSNSNKDYLEEIRDRLGALKEGRGFLDTRHEEAVKTLGGTVSDKFDVGDSKKLLEAAHAGDMDTVHKMIQESDLSTADKDELFKKVNKQSENVRAIKYRRDNYTGNENDMYKELKEKYGINGINKDNLDKFRSTLDSEISSRQKPTALKEGEAPAQSTEITSALDANTDKLAEYLKAQTELLAQIRDNAMGITKDQYSSLKATRHLGEAVAEDYSKSNHNSAARKNKIISKMYGKDFKLDDRHENTFQDNDYKYKQVKALGKSSYLFTDLNKVLDFDDNSFKRFVQLAKCGYRIKDYKKISEVSDSGFENILKMSEVGFKITDLDQIINADPKAIEDIIDLYTNGYGNVGQKDLFNLTGKKSQLLHGKQSDAAKVTSRFTKNADFDKSGDTIEKTHDNTNGPKALTKMQQAKSFLSSLGSSVMAEYGEPTTLSKGELVVKSAISEHANGTAALTNSNSTVINTDYGPMTYNRSSDGGMEMSKDKENTDIADKIKDRDTTQKGILENLKIMAGNAKDGAKDKLGKAGSAVKGGILGGLLDLLKLPMTMLKSFGSLLNLPMELLGMGGVLPKLAGKAIGMAGGALGSIASKGVGMLAGTALGKKVGGLMNKFSNTKIGRGFGKIKSALGFGGGSGVDANGNAVDNPTDAADAVNSSRDTLASYLQRIIDILGGGKMDGASSLADSLGGGNTPGGTTKGGKLARAGGFLKRHAGKIAGAGILAYQAYKGFGGGGGDSGEEVGDSGSSLTDYALDAAGVLGVTGLPSGLGEFASGVLTKTKDALSTLASKLAKFIPKGAGEAVQKFFGAIMNRVKDPKTIAKIATRVGIKAGFDVAEATAGAGTLGLGALAIGAGEATMWFMKGWNNASENFDLQNGASPTMAMKIISGLSEAVVGMTPIGYVIDTKDVTDLATDYLGTALGFSKSDVQKINADATTADSTNTDNADKGFLSNAWDKTKSFVSNAWDSAKSVAGSVVDGAKSMYNTATNAASTWWGNHFGGNSGTGKGKYGRGVGAIGSAFHSQLDPANAMQFNASGDTEAQTMADSGCGPVSATNMAAAMGINIDPKQAASYALGKGYKEKDGGTRPGFFGDYLGKYGIGTEQVSTSSAMDSLKSGSPVVLMGKDNAGVSDKTPYGQYNHYVTATGTDGKGNITVQDPESNTPDQVYKASDVLNKSSIAIAGKGKFGRGKPSSRGVGMMSSANKALSARGKTGRGKWGRGNDDVPGQIWDFLASKGLGSSTISAIMGNIGHESGGFNLEALSKDGENSYGLCQWTDSRKENLFNLASQMGKSPADLDVQLAYLWQELTTGGYAKALDDTIAKGDDIEGATDVFCDEFEAPRAGYEHFDRRHEIAQQAFQTQGKGMQTANTYSGSSQGGSSGDKKSGKDYSGVFGQIAQITDALSSAFDLSSNNAMNGNTKPVSTQQTAAAQATANPDALMAKLKANQIGVDDYIQQADDNPDVSRDIIWNRLESNGFGDDNTKAAYDKYYSSMDSASKSDGFLKLVDDMKAQKISIESFIQQADGLKDNIPRNMIKHVFMQNGMWDDNTKAAYDAYYDKKDGNSGSGKWGRGKGKINLFGRGTDDASAPATTDATTATPAATPTASTATNPAASSSGGILGTALSAATSMASKVKSSLGPLASSIGSAATSMFGGNIAKVFGSNNPFTSIFSSGKKDSKSSGNTASNGSFTSTASSEGVRNASNWAQGVIDQVQDGVNPPYWYGENGCTAFTQEYLKQEGNPFADQMSLYAPTLMEQAKSSGLWKDPSQGGSEGDIALLETNQNPGDGPDHAVINDGQDGFWGNSSSGRKIVHDKYSSYFGANNIDGYISTGSGSNTVATGDANDPAAARANAGPTSGGGKYGRGKFGRGILPMFGRGLDDPLATIKSKIKDIPGKFSNQFRITDDDTPESAKAKLFAAGKAQDLDAQQKAQQTGTGKFGRGSIDDIRSSLNGIDMSNIPSYNIINDNDSIDVANAKAEKIRQLDAETQRRIMSPSTSTSPSVTQSAQPATPQVVQQAPQVNVPDNGDKLDKMINLLTIIATALTSGQTGNNNSSNQSALANLTKSGGGLSNVMGGTDSSSIMAALAGIVGR